MIASSSSMPSQSSEGRSSRAAQLDFLLALFQPLIRVADVRFLLDDCSPDHVERLIDDGTLRGVDIRTEGSKQRCLRVYRYSVEHLKLQPDWPLTWINPREIFLHHRDTWLRREVQQLLSCSDDHVRNLDLPGPRYGADSTGRVQRIYADALADFLTRREIR